MRTHVTWIIAFVVAVWLVPTLHAQAQRVSDDTIIDTFALSVANSALPPALKQQVGRIIATDRRDAAKQREVITTSLIAIYPDLGKALAALADDRMGEAIARFGELAQRDDPYLSVHANFFLSRALVTEERYEEAMPVLDDLVSRHADQTLYAGDAIFYQGVAQANSLQRKEAAATLERFVRQYPDSPERMLVGAIHLIDQLAQIEDGRLSDVQDRMAFSRRRLDLERTDKPTQEEQTRIIAILDQLIKEAEDKEKGGGGGGGGGGGSGRGGGGQANGNQQSGGPAQNSTAPVGEARVGSQHAVNRGDPADQWGKLQERQRQEVLDALKTRFPDRYRELVEQYYKGLQEDDTSGR
ncbi:MAG: tetratricopeptide repeat protein [Phycisphaeraceae bacterium]